MCIHIAVQDLDHLLSRPPVVTIMGHVDHGKVGRSCAWQAVRSQQAQTVHGTFRHLMPYIRVYRDA